MKKILTIGRGAQCDICINDSTDVVSRNHAILEIKSNNKYFIIDQSRNGTYVNGMRITPNEKVPITRDDVVSFAHIRELDWSLVPKSNNLSLWLGLAAAVVLALIVVLLLFFHKRNDGNLNLLSKEGLYEQTDNGGGNVLNPAPQDQTDNSAAEGDEADAADPNDKNDQTEAEQSDDKNDKTKAEEPAQPKKQTTKKDNPVDAIL